MSRRNDMPAPPASPTQIFLAWVGFLVAMFATFFFLILLGDRPFGPQIVSLVADSVLVFYLVFFDTRLGRGYRLRNKAIQQELPHLLRIHGLYLVLLFALLTFVLSVRPNLPQSWLVESGPKDVSRFAFGLILIGVITVMTQAWTYRKILSRVLERRAVSP